MLEKKKMITRIMRHLISSAIDECLFNYPRKERFESLEDRAIHTCFVIEMMLIVDQISIEEEIELRKFAQRESEATEKIIEMIKNKRLS